MKKITIKKLKEHRKLKMERLNSALTVNISEEAENEFWTGLQDIVSEEFPEGNVTPEKIKELLISDLSSALVIDGVLAPFIETLDVLMNSPYAQEFCDNVNKISNGESIFN